MCIRDRFIDFGRMFFVAGLWLICLCAMLDETSWFRKIMSASVFEPLAKIQYMAYLIHPIVLNIQTYSSDTSLYYGNSVMLYNTLTDLVIIFFFSLILHVIIEQTFINIEGTYLFPRKPSGPKKVAPVAEKKEEAQSPSSMQSLIQRNVLAYDVVIYIYICLLYTSPSPRDGLLSRMPSSA
eukprot:TRINITY_DN2224_c0_g1_i2.p1 TRINITY_DN2224_c0_g1~~TRINITY_DN2224_c0_g1_i2.p1  ORF type:complete len:181 (-),score=50.64 TRINITY_DN2224_c0_g1_i2:96-638(-)